VDDGDQVEGRAVADDPLEVVDQAPVDVAAQVDAGEAGVHAGQRSPDVLDALGVVLGPGRLLYGRSAGAREGSHRCADFGTPALINCAIDPTARTKSGHIGNLNPQNSISQKK
jgi:hypothetical protein